MNIISLFSEIEKVDPEVYGRFDSRRRVFQHMAGLGGRLAAAALPLALGSLFNKAYAGATITQAGATPVAPAPADFDYTGSQGGTRAALFADVLTNAATMLAVAQALEDTGVRAYKGSAADLMNNSSTNPVLEAALNIHSVEARHASRLRTMRRGGLMPANDRASFVAAGTNPSSSPKSWVSGIDNGGPAPTATRPEYTPA